MADQPTEQERAAAFNWLRDNGYDTEDFESLARLLMWARMNAPSDEIK